MIRLGYNTNGFANHDPLHAVSVLHALNYRGVALTVDHHLLNPDDPSLERQASELKDVLAETGMSSVIESGARFLLDPFEKHQPTLISPTAELRARRAVFLRHCIDMAARLESDCVSLWSGTPIDEAGEDELLKRLADELRDLLEYADSKNVRLAFEPEPGMFIATMACFDRLAQWVDDRRLELTLDVGHLYCQGEVPIVNYIERYADRVINVHIEDMRAGVHEHLMFGEGEMRFPPIIEALVDAGYEGGLYVELSRHSHCAPAAAKQARDFLEPMIELAEQHRSHRS